jgi:hypothetical protein
VRDGKWI